MTTTATLNHRRYRLWVWWKLALEVIYQRVPVGGVAPAQVIKHVLHGFLGVLVYLTADSDSRIDQPVGQVREGDMRLGLMAWRGL